MRLTVKEALSIYPLSEAKLVAGSEGTMRMMKSVNVMDAPDIADWIKNGEMLFTTGFIFKDSQEGVMRLLQRLDERGCAGLGVKLGRFWQHIPEQVIEEADRLKFPLLELPFQFTFSDQMDALFRAEYERSTKALQSIVDRQKRLMQFALRKGTDPNVFAGLSEVLGCRLAVIGSRGHVLFANTDEGAQPGLMQGWPWKPMYSKTKWRAGLCHRMPIRQQEEEYGFLLVFTESPHSPRSEEGLYQQAAEVLAYYMDLTYREHIHPTVQDEMKTVMMQYLNSKISSSDLVSYTAGKGVSLAEGAYQCVLTTLEPAAFSSQKLLKQIHRELQYNPLMQLSSAHHFHVDQGILSIYSCPTGKDSGERLVKFLSSRFSDIIESQRAKNEPEPRFWISKMKPGLAQLREAYQECLETRKLAIRFGMEDTALQFDTLEFAYVYQHVPAEVMSNYCDKLLEPLLRDGEANHMLMLTLEAFIEHDGLINEAAKRLYVHRNTVTYRMDKIAGLLQMDFKKNNDLLKLKMAFTFRKFLQSADQKRGE
ncbi:PucR family transcriptional regulator [Paenibacillus enshidis]|uniref:PucR family transcriptional regulator n=1 Tax=Paenibacillus enshidis TaxID=1458439 RepID=A0ABV5AMZ6_9BACL